MSSYLARFKSMMFCLLAGLLLVGCVGLTLQDEISGLMKQGEALYAQKKYDEALGRFADVILKDPQYWRAYVWSARTLVAKGNWFDAINSAKKAFDMAPKGDEVLPVLAEALLGGGTDALKNGRYAESAGYLFDYLKLEPNNAGAWLNMGRAYLGQKQYREALNSFVQGLSKGSGQDKGELLSAMFDGGVQALKQGKTKDAIATLKEYVKHDADHVPAYVNLGKAYLESGELGNSLETFRRLLKLDPTNQDALRFLQRL